MNSVFDESSVKLDFSSSVSELSLGLEEFGLDWTAVAIALGLLEGVHNTGGNFCVDLGKDYAVVNFADFSILFSTAVGTVNKNNTVVYTVPVQWKHLLS